MLLFVSVLITFSTCFFHHLCCSCENLETKFHTNHREKQKTENQVVNSKPPSWLFLDFTSPSPQNCHTKTRGPMEGTIFSQISIVVCSIVIIQFFSMAPVKYKVQHQIFVPPNWLDYNLLFVATVQLSNGRFEVVICLRRKPFWLLRDQLLGCRWMARFKTWLERAQKMGQ